jgi:hypothetical protein
MRRAQATVLLVAVLLPVAGVAMVGLALLGARVQGERAQRLADGAALTMARGRTPVVPPGVELDAAPFGGGTRVTVRLTRAHSTLQVGLAGAITATATAVARPITTADGRPGAVLVG